MEHALGCSELLNLGGIEASFQCRTYPTLQRICDVFNDRVRRFLTLAGFAEEYIDVAQQAIVNSVRRHLQPFMANLPPIMQQSCLIRARRQIWNGGMILIRVDRNPGRLVAVCREL